MSIRNILVHLANDDHHTVRLEAGLALVRRFDAHLKVLYTATPIDMPAAIEGRAASYSYIMQQAEMAKARAAETEQELKALYAGAEGTYTFTVEEGDPLELLAEHSHYADLAIVTQTCRFTLEDRLRLQLPVHLPVLAGCPTLILPETLKDVSYLGKYPLIAWKANKGANRVLRDSMTFLREAEKISVVMVHRDGKNSVNAIRQYMNAHGIGADYTEETGGDGVAADRILRQAEAKNCDMIVMGGYGHSRLHYMMGSGVTNYVTSHANVPILMSH